MTNPHRAERSIEIGGKTLILRFDDDACARAEQAFGSNIYAAVQRGWVQFCKAMLPLGLHNRHNAPDDVKTALKKFDMRHTRYYMKTILDAVEASGYRAFLDDLADEDDEEDEGGYSDPEDEAGEG